MGQLNIPSSAVIYVDTAIVIYSVEFNPDYWQLLQPLWAKLQANEISIVSSELTLMECLVVPLRNGNNLLVDTYEQLLSSQVSLVPISQTILKNAAQLRATTNLRTPDAIHGATALSQGCTLFITNDTGFRNVPNLSVVILSEVLAS
ncbi:type II toxin-antitoxin system VapC family toxin [Microseira wollei]|uniref:PilT protein domain protein n=1 Tax=Microseira wollei NIES-4236 TaxID=2530354 RepID=A0AAV3XAI2_9CYAN|nr:PIN domain-containing protein [Microseira wollei]GET39458.1 PilT protein domain protein [Microseira wollei NIES-4236]